MPYSTVASARKSIPSLKSLSTQQVEKFINIFNTLLSEGMEESKAIPIAISRAKKQNMNKLSKENLLKMFGEFIDEHFGGSKTNNDEHVEDIIKSVDEMERRALFVVLEPQSSEDVTTDLHGDFYDEITVEKACRSFNKHSMKAGLFHKMLVEDDLVEIEQSFINPSDFYIDDGRIIRKGSWLMWMHFPEPSDDTEDSVWPKVLTGEYSGVSVDCSGTCEDL